MVGMGQVGQFGTLILRPATGLNEMEKQLLQEPLQKCPAAVSSQASIGPPVDSTSFVPQPISPIRKRQGRQGSHAPLDHRNITLQELRPFGPRHTRRAGEELPLAAATGKQFQTCDRPR